ncbi:MAG: hypothetical protein IPK83_02225 [Planctomycetes bacterium]|nr:hypothetical protein [Planctomycetota bacterium]
MMQRILYGSTLEEHIRVDVVTKKLFFEGLPVSPHVVFVDSVELLPARRLLGLPIARLSRQESKGDSGMSLSSLVYDVADEYLDQQVVGDVVSKLEGLIDLFEPFERMEKALKEVMRNENSK